MKRWIIPVIIGVLAALVLVLGVTLLLGGNEPGKAEVPPPSPTQQEAVTPSPAPAQEEPEEEPAPSPTPEVTPESTPTPVPAPAPSAVPTPKPSATPAPTPTPTPTPEPTPTPVRKAQYDPDTVTEYGYEGYPPIPDFGSLWGIDSGSPDYDETSVGIQDYFFYNLSDLPDSAQAVTESYYEVLRDWGFASNSWNNNGAATFCYSEEDSRIRLTYQYREDQVIVTVRILNEA